MAKRPKRFWRIEIEEGHVPVFRRILPGNLSENEVATLLQRLACRKLTANEIVGASLRAPKAAALLDVRFEHLPKAARPLIWLTTFPHFIASLWAADELPQEPEIGSDF